MDAYAPAALIDALEDVLVNTLALARELSPEQAELPTDCPGWTVRDQLSHIVALEQQLQGSPNVPLELPDLPHVTSDFDRFTEVGVHARRFLPIAAVADELAGLLPRRIGALRQQLGGGDDPEIDSPFGVRPMSKALPIRIFDTWTHEQDIRRAVGAPVRTDGLAAEIALRQSLKAWSIVLPQIDGIAGTVTIRVAGEGPAPTVVTIGDGGGAAAEITGGVAALTWLSTGRGRLEDAPVETSGDEGLLAVVADHLAVTP